MKLLKSFFNYHFLLLAGKIRIRCIRNNSEEIINDSGHLFLQVSVPQNEILTHKTKLNISFRVNKLSLFQRSILPVLSTPFYAGFRGFISKKFYICRESNILRGHYEWEKTEDINNYITSAAMKFMRIISIPGSLNYEIKEN
ncbi:MAG TPA: hypothetical protein PLH15_05865 [Spirochaetota bacterium]|nr:hypothetical protein [Spirochaetota bacterium]HQO21510.1 hypothetical protein [Spirochaetota bacterium]HQQ23348.1 hypothetical protein [Spirochaetota bacterium]